ncbi:hypothetical protein ACIBSV_14785 [Embleya sp. NPDC050154]|uniref:hypothetical protein n=1 Tax=Embleya sp. NPDC050154 TaxID=3363988 RepID=UPI0037B8E1A4
MTTPIEDLTQEVSALKKKYEDLTAPGSNLIPRSEFGKLFEDESKKQEAAKGAEGGQSGNLLKYDEAGKLLAPERAFAKSEENTAKWEIDGIFGQLNLLGIGLNILKFELQPLKDLSAPANRWLHNRGWGTDPDAVDKKLEKLDDDIEKVDRKVEENYDKLLRQNTAFNQKHRDAMIAATKAMDHSVLTRRLAVRASGTARTVDRRIETARAVALPTTPDINTLHTAVTRLVAALNT